MASETRKCAKCGGDFLLNEDDLGFLAGLRLPLPTRCPNCQLQRRLAFRNERSIYKRKCDVPGHTEDIISNYAAERKQPVYDLKYWWSDSWDPLSYGRDFDPGRPFFDQVRELMEQVPVPALVLFNSVNSDYGNFTTDNKNCYLVFGGDFNEDCMYSTFNFYSKDTSDVYWVDKCELCYELVDSEACYKTRFGRYVENCSDCMFVYDCYGCNNCVGCVGLRSKSYHILNQPYSKEEYAKKLESLRLDTRSGQEAFQKEFEALRLSLPHRYAHIFKSVGASGDNIVNSKSCVNCFDVGGPAENLSNVLLGGWGLKDARNVDHAGHKAEQVYDSMGTFDNASRVFYSVLTSTSQEVYYSWNCRGSHDIFGCVNLRNAQYCILNKQYSKEEYEALLPKVTAQMDSLPYAAKDGTSYRFGEFFPPELSPFGYNETIAQEYFPLSREEAAALGSGWKEEEGRNYAATLQPEDLPDSIDTVTEDVLKETIACAHRGTCNEHCTTAFRITPAELQLYRRLQVPLPQFCPSCRHYARVKRRPPIRLWERACQCAGAASDGAKYANSSAHAHGGGHCPERFQTTFSPERPEIVYCEQCYQAETA